MVPRLHCGHAVLAVGPRIGRGGEGEIYRTADGSGRAVKLYLNPDPARETKVRAMISARLAERCPNVAFPREIVHHADGRFAGFIMTEVQGQQPIHELMAGRSRRQFFPQANWRFLVRTAINVARAIATVHAAGAIIGDINSSGILIAQDATVTLIDADSFQIGAHRCRVGMPEYTPPELIGVRLGDVDRTKEHDQFGLAVILFQLLFLGRHPYAGVTRGRPVPIEKAIADQRFAFSELRSLGVAPPPHTLRLGDLPRAIRLAFERAFAMRGAARPTAADWARELTILEEMLAPCSADPRHVLPSRSAACPWCRIERGTGRPTFSHAVQMPVVRQLPQHSTLRSDVVRAIDHAKRDAGERIEPLWQRQPVKPSKAARAIHAQDKQQSVPSSTSALRRLGFAPDIPPKFAAERQASHVVAERRLDEWRTQLGIWNVYKACDDLYRKLGDLERYHTLRPSLLARALSRIIDQRVSQIIAGHMIASAGLAGIGAVLEAHLAHRGIRSAADIDRNRLAAVPGLGERRIVALLFWREMVSVAAEREAARASATTSSAADAAADAVDRHIASVEASIRHAIVDLASMVARIREATKIVDPKLDKVLAKRDQARADLHLLGIAIDPRQPAPASFKLPSPPPATSTKRKSKAVTAKKMAPGCPQCGSPMVKRWANSANGKKAIYLGCSAYPRCNGRRPTRSRQALP